jgi:lysine/ornithine N-monooxygenase
MRFRYVEDRKKQDRSAVVRVVVCGKSAAEVVAETQRQKAEASIGGLS